MRLHSLRLRGITEAFPDEVCVDFDRLGEGLIALVGENGAGKSTLIGSVSAALFRQLPSLKLTSLSVSTVPATGRFSRLTPSPARWRAISSTAR
jgi:DNA repair exonuclease SbcCD ATPase subunit